MLHFLPHFVVFPRSPFPVPCSLFPTFIVIKILSEHLQTICTHAESTYPEECCGLLLGHLQENQKTVVEVWQTENVWSAETFEVFPEIAHEASKRRRYAIAPETILKAQKEARDRQLNIIGIYHSHTDNPAIPSEIDRLCAWQEYSYIIVSVQQGKAGDILSWSLNDEHQFQPEQIITG